MEPFRIEQASGEYSTLKPWGDRSWQQEFFDDKGHAKKGNQSHRPEYVLAIIPAQVAVEFQEWVRRLALDPSKPPEAVWALLKAWTGRDLADAKAAAAELVQRVAWAELARNTIEAAGWDR